MQPKIKPGDELYVGDSWSIDHGETDMCGGIAIVKRLSKCGDTVFVDVGLGHCPNLKYVLENQADWEKEFENRLAHDCPDVPGHTCPHPKRMCSRCDGTGIVLAMGFCSDCVGTGKGKIKKNSATLPIDRDTLMKEAGT